MSRVPSHLFVNLTDSATARQLITDSVAAIEPMFPMRSPIE